MARKYSVMVEKVAVSAVQDFISILGVTGVVGFLKGIEINAADATPIANQGMVLRVSYLTATVTAGSGGGSATVTKNDPGDAAATITARKNDTIQATSSGSKTAVFETAFSSLAGYAIDFDDLRFPMIPGTSYVVEIITTPAASITLSGTVTVLEVG